jgi:hypothetical protein
MTSIRRYLQEAASKAGIVITFTAWDFRKYSSQQPTGEVTHYFSECIPDKPINLENFIIHSFVDLDFHNTELIPSCYIVPFGFITICTSSEGDCYAVDIATGIVYLISHEKFEDGMIQQGWNTDFSGFLPPISISRDSIIASAEDEISDIPTAIEYFVTKNSG